MIFVKQIKLKGVHYHFLELEVFEINLGYQFHCLVQDRGQDDQGRKIQLERLISQLCLKGGED
jgi:hypothetical protein